MRRHAEEDEEERREQGRQKQLGREIPSQIWTSYICPE
jgi:hypothetical protein